MCHVKEGEGSCAPQYTQTLPTKEHVPSDLNTQRKLFEQDAHLQSSFPGRHLDELNEAVIHSEACPPSPHPRSLLLHTRRGFLVLGWQAPWRALTKPPFDSTKWAEREAGEGSSWYIPEDGNT